MRLGGAYFFWGGGGGESVIKIFINGNLLRGCWPQYTVKPLFSGHPQDLSKYPLNRGCPLNRGLL